MTDSGHQLADLPPDIDLLRELGADPRKSGVGTVNHGYNNNSATGMLPVR
jgi:hypothetical protein